MFGESLEWNFKESNKQQSIRSNCYLGGIDDEEKWTDIQEDLVDRLIKLEEALRPYISEFLVKSVGVKGMYNQYNTVSETKLLQQEYWQGLKDFMENQKSFVKMRTPLVQNWSDISIGRSDIYISAAVYSKRKTIEVWLVFAGNNTKNNFDKLYEIAYDKSLTEIDEKIVWDRMDQIKRCAVILRLEADYTQKNEWENQFNWFKDNLEKFYKLFKPLLKII